MLLKRISALLFAIILAQNVGAIKFREVSSSLSPGIAVLQSKQKIIKTSIPGSSIRFTTDDFDRYLGKDQYSAIMIKSLPDKSVGTLLKDKSQVHLNDRIEKKDINLLSLFPAGTNEKTTSFSFTTPETNAVFQYTLKFTENKNTITSARHMEFSTYRNAEIQGQIPMAKTENIVIEKNCREGILSLDPNNGVFTYAPETNFYGTDCFYYKICDDLGNFTETKAVLIRVKKADKNLYFCDLKENPIHHLAIRLCEEKILDYKINENGLPVFSPNDILNNAEKEKSLHKLSEKYRNISLQASLIMTEEKDITREEFVLRLKEFFI